MVDRWTDQWTDRLMVKASYRDAWTHLKIKISSQPLVHQTFTKSYTDTGSLTTCMRSLLFHLSSNSPLSQSWVLSTRQCRKLRGFDFRCICRFHLVYSAFCFIYSSAGGARGLGPQRLGGRPSFLRGKGAWWNAGTQWVGMEQGKGRNVGVQCIGREQVKGGMAGGSESAENRERGGMLGHKLTQSRAGWDAMQGAVHAQFRDAKRSARTSPRQYRQCGG